MTKRLVGLLILAGALSVAGCDSGGGGSAPKADNKGAQFKELPAPASPAGGGNAKQPGAGAKAD